MRLQSEIAGCLRIGLQRAGKRFTWQFWKTGIFHRVDSKNATLVNNSPIFTNRPENQFARLWSLLIEDYQRVDKYASA